MITLQLFNRYVRVNNLSFKWEDRTKRDDTRARLIAYYLPQYHPIPENDDWWGRGFTEWTNVGKARPLFRNHQQPRLPTDLGYYDLRVPETREAQAEMARSCGVEGFCYWHYWFGHGRRILERPFSEVLTSKRPHFPFCLSWANQTWSGIWHGDANRVLVEQVYPGKDDERAHFEMLRPAFEDERYIKVDGKPLFAVYMPFDLPSISAFTDHWRELALRAGLPGLFLVATWHHSLDERLKTFDAVTPNGPSDFFFSDARLRSRVRRRLSESKVGRLWGEIFTSKYGAVRRNHYDHLVRHGQRKLSGREIPCVVPNWDNTPRSGRRGRVIVGSTPKKFESYVDNVVRQIETRPLGERIIFLKAWNEWAEGNYVEPDQLFGSGYLDALRTSLMRNVDRA